MQIWIKICKILWGIKRDWDGLNYCVRTIHIAFNSNVVLHSPLDIISSRIPIVTCIFFLNSPWLWELHSLCLEEAFLLSFFQVCLFLSMCPELLYTSQAYFYILDMGNGLLQSPWLYCLRKTSHSAYLAVVVHLAKARFVSCISAELAHQPLFANCSLHCSCQSSLSLSCFLCFDSLWEWEWGSRATLFYWSCTCHIEFKVQAHFFSAFCGETWYHGSVNALKHSFLLKQIRILLRIHFSTAKMVARNPQHSLCAHWTWHLFLRNPEEQWQGKASGPSLNKLYYKVGFLKVE